MNYVIQLGPVGLNGFILIALSAWLIATLGLKIISHLKNMSTETAQTLLEGALISSAAGARLVFAVQYWPSFSDKPWQVLYFWQGGFNAWGAIAAAVVFIGFKLIKIPTAHRLQLSLLTIFALLLTASAFFAGRWLVETNQSPVISPLTVAAELTDRQNNLVSLNDFNGQPTVVNFWATWCPPCRREMPLLEESYHQLNAMGVALVLINVGESGEVIETYLKENNLTLAVLKNGTHSTEQLFNLVGGKVMPTTLFIAANGQVVHSRVGELSAATLQQGVDKIVEH